MVRKEMTAVNAQARLEDLCSRSEHFSSEIMLLLRKWGIDNTTAEAILEDLIEGRFVDDWRCSRAFVNDKVRFSGYGRVKIGLLLRQKGVPQELISEALGQIDEEEYLDVLRRVLAQKARRLGDLSTFENRTKLYRYGLGRGYESNLVSQEVKRLARGEE